MRFRASSVASKNPDLLKAMCSVLDENTENSTKFDELDKFDDVDILDVYRNSFQSADDLFVRYVQPRNDSDHEEFSVVNSEKVGLVRMRYVRCTLPTVSVTLFLRTRQS